MRQPAEPVRVVEVLRRLSRGAGIQMVIRRLVEHVDPARVEMHVVVVKAIREEDALERLPARVRSLGEPGGAYTLARRVSIMAAVAREVHAAHADVVHLHSGSTWLGLFARLRDRHATYLIDVHDPPGSGRQRRVTDWLEGRWSSWLGAHLVCHSEPVAAEIRRHWRVAPDRLTVIPLAVDQSVFGPAPPDARARWRAEHGIGDQQLLLVAAGRLAPSKRFDRAIAVLADLRGRGVDAALAIVGTGKLEAVLREQASAEATAAHVVFTAPRFVSSEELAAALGAADVLCSTSEYEGFGLTLIEGMACGLPVVASSVGGVTDIVVDGTTGFLVAADDFEGFADRVALLADDSERRRAMGTAARRRVEERFHVSVFAGAFADLFTRIAGRPS